MTWTYGKPLDSRKDEVRFLIGDTNEDLDEQLLQDEEIEYALAVYPISTDVVNEDGSVTIDRRRQPLYAALICAEAIWSYFQRQANEQLPPVNFEYENRAKNYKTKVEYLQKLLITRGGIQVYAGGTSRIDKEIIRSNDDTVRPFFRRYIDDNFSTLSATQSNLLGEI